MNRIIMEPVTDAVGITVSQVLLSDTQCVLELDAYVMEHPHSTPFHRPAWVRAVARGARQRALMLVARDSRGAIVGLVPLNIIHSLLFGRALVSSGFAVDGGILADTQAIADVLADTSWRLAERLSCGTAELRGGMLPSANWAIKANAYLNFSKSLATDDDAQLAAVPKRHRAEIRKGLENGLEIIIGRDKALRDIHYRLYAESVHNLGTPVFPRALFEEVLDAFDETADVAVVRKDGVPVSAVISLYHHGACMPYWHGASPLARTLRANEVLYFRLMGLARNRGMTKFDFGRSKVGTGPAAWKKNWGWEGEPLCYAVRARPGKEARDINPLSPQYQRKVELWKKLPLPIANRVGPHIARGLG